MKWARRWDVGEMRIKEDEINVKLYFLNGCEWKWKGIIM